MSESIEIKNFLVIKKADIELKKINVIIGPQANGKSIIAKLVYFFQSISSEFIDSIRAQTPKRELDKAILINFESKFPRYSWDNTKFEINYKLNDLNISITGDKNSRGKTTLTINYSKDLHTLINSKKRMFLKKLEECKNQENDTKRLPYNLEHRVMKEHVLEPLKHSEFSSFFSDSVFIPASRSFFANLQKNIFTFLASNLDIDPFLKDFGSLYENSKRWYKDSLFLNKKSTLRTELNKILVSIVGGEYEHHEEKDWIVSKSRRINLINASSGQQESLPMLLVLSVWPLLRSQFGPETYFIEEPEAHLFPTSQGHIVSLLSLLYDNVDTRFFITTHSPYILAALNNFIMAGDEVAKGNITKDEFTKLNGSGVPINFEDVSAYTIEKGYAESISDSEFRMIGAEMLDGISDHFENVMNTLLDCENS